MVLPYKEKVVWLPYSFTDENCSYQSVCSTFFVRTLGYQSNNVLTAFNKLGALDADNTLFVLINDWTLLVLSMLVPIGSVALLTCAKFKIVQVEKVCWQ